MFAAAAVALIRAVPAIEFAALGDGPLVAEYRAAWPEVRADWRRGRMNPSRSGPPPRFARVRDEIVRRGGPVVPALLDLLRAEAVGPPAPLMGENLAGDVLEVHVAVGDPRAVPAAVAVADGLSDQVPPRTRRAALYAVERLTRCSMRRTPLDCYRLATVQHPTALDVERYDDAEAVAVRLYRDWLAGEGADPARWLALARDRAESLLAGDDPRTVFGAAQFLKDQGGNRVAAAARVAAVLAELAGPDPDWKLYRGKPAGMPVGNWAKLLADFGRLARPHARTLIRLQTEHGENAWADYANLREVGGDEAMAHLFAALPRVSAEVAKIKADPATPRGFTNDDPRGWWFDSLREVQLACDLWAGRRFDTDAARVAWWAANRGRPRADWLAENLPTVMEQADAGDPWADCVARAVVPALPEVYAPPGSRVGWLAANRSRLRYDPVEEVFRLDPGAR